MSTNPFPSPTPLQNQVMGWTSFGLMLAPVVLQLVAQIQLMFGKGKGETKSNVAQTVVQAAVPGVPAEVVQPVIDASVVALKAAGHPAFVDAQQPAS